MGGGRGQRDLEDPADRLEGHADGWMDRWKLILSEGEMMKNRFVNNENADEIKLKIPR